jgi:hypothetical protein
LLRLAEGYEQDLRFGASFASTIPEDALLARRKIADTICDLYHDPLDEKEQRRGVRFDLRGEKFRLGFVKLDSAYGGEVFVSCRSGNNDSKPPKDDKEPWLIPTSETSPKWAGRVSKDDRDEGDHLDPILSTSCIETFFDTESESS